MRCNGMRSYEFVMRCGWLRCHVVWFEVVVWGELEDDLVIRTTQIYSVLHSTTPVLLRTTRYRSSTTPYYKVLLQYYTVLQSTTPILFCTTKYYSSTTLYYKVLLQYSVLQSTTPVLLCTTLQGTTPVLVCTTKYYSSTILYYTVLL